MTGIGLGCTDKTDPQFAADTYDEYTEPLTDAVIGTPAGTTTIGADGETTFVAAAAVAAGRAGAPGMGGSGVAGRSGAGGSIGTGGSFVADGGVATGGRPGLGGAFGTGGLPTGGVSGTGGLPGTGGNVTGTGGFTGVGGVGGVAGSQGIGGRGGSDAPGGFGLWHFDDCSPTSHFLADSSGLGANAQQALKADCVPGINNLGVQIRSAKDIIQVPDEPQFTVTNRIAVAAWVHPNTVSGNQPIVIKRLNNQTSFSLGIHNGNIEMSVVMSTGKTVISSAPISAGVWTHVAGMYDGTFVFLFINGQQFGQVFAGGTLRNVFAPLRFGATTQAQFLDGTLDEVFVSTQPISKDDLTALSCFSRPSSLSVNPAASGPTPPDTSVHFDVLVTDNDVGFCQPRQYNAFINSFETGINASFEVPTFQPASPGQTVTFGADVTGSDDADPGVHVVQVGVVAFTQSSFEQLSGQFSFELQPPTGCFVSKRKELMITSTSVVDDPVRTTGDGAWSFGHVLRQLAPSAEQAPAFALALFQHWLTDQTVNGFRVAARPSMQQQILDVWPKTASGDLDLDQPPFVLQAIVNRFDLRDPASGSAGEGRLVYALMPKGFFFGEDFTVIIEYNLPAANPQAVTDWANRWHALGSVPADQYNAALEAITRSFTDRDPAATMTKVNGSNVLQLRTNDLQLSNNGRWELREFQLSPTTGFFDEVTVKETPDLGFNGTQPFADFVNQNEQAIIAVVPGAPSSTVPDVFENQSFLAGSVFNDLIEWNGPGIRNPEARFHASLNTCNGCHGPETNTTFLMINPRSVGSEAGLSPFLTGTLAFDQFTGQQRQLNDLGRRQADLTGVVCAPPLAVGAVAAK
ncbi:MAG TPA: LamG domain-containing protein [Polyangia bacterium]|nr:LamG domain-containing protein [Polyangia bacterium]